MFFADACEIILLRLLRPHHSIHHPDELTNEREIILVHSSYDVRESHISVDFIHIHIDKGDFAKIHTYIEAKKDGSRCEDNQDVVLINIQR
jgi:hypothetical protein